MRRRLPAIAVLAPILVALTLALPPSRAEAIAFGACAHAPGFSCATLEVPVLRSEPQLGEVTLHLERLLGGQTPSKDAVLALAGGPGQPALPLAGYFAQAMTPALGQRDLIVFDQRGTGESDPLDCPALHGDAGTLGQLVEQCAQQIGAARSGYSTAESVQDIDAIRQALGYEKLVLYGTSYGTKVALQYAQTFPTHVESLVLDSVVQPAGVDPLDLATLKALRPVLSELCSQHACHGITPDPLGDIARLASRLRRRPLAGFVYDGSGRRHAATLDEEQMFEILLSGDLNPALRAMTPAAVRSALRGDSAPLLRLHLLSEGLVPNLPGHPPVPDLALETDTTLLIDTTCEDTAYPWNRSSSPQGRLREAFSAFQAQPASAFYPFDAVTAATAGLLGGCAYWPYDSPAPGVPGPLPDVPTLIVSGAQDLRTPTSGARELAAAIPQAKLLVVPYTGHSVLGSDFSGCAKVAVEAFFEGAQVLPCGPIPDLFSPTPPIPTSLRGLPGVAGMPLHVARTLRAVLDTMVDLDRQVIVATLQAEQRLPSGSSFGGLAGGYARLTTTALRLHRFAFVPGIQLDGAFPVRKGEVGTASVHVGGSAAARGSIRVAPDGRVSGVLEGHRFAVGTGSSAVAATATRRHRWPGLQRDLLPRQVFFPHGRLALQP
jgi:pimeloyl-ACP methyl ester carboxylesterase